jgi:dUTP pyrophosphatase
VSLSVHIVQLPHGLDLPLPHYASEEAAGMDVYAAISPKTPVVLEKMQRALIPTGIALHIPVKFEAQVRPRSGLALRHGVTVLNSPGTIDSDYRGEICVLLINLGDAPFSIERGMRVAQLVFAPVTQVAWQPADSLSGTPRNTNGFGSTGL